MAHILLIEGHRLMRSALTDLLAQHGAHRINAAADPLSAVHMVMQEPPQIIVLESIWTEINGVYLSRILREVAPQAKIILLVDEGWATSADVQQSSGADSLIDKAVLVKELPMLLAEMQTAIVPLSVPDSPQ